MNIDLDTIEKTAVIITAIFTIAVYICNVKQKKKRDINQRIPEIEIHKNMQNKTKYLSLINIKGVPILNFSIEVLDKQYEHRLPNIKELQPRNLDKNDEIKVLYSSAIGEKNLVQFKMKWQDIDKKEYETIKEIELN